MAAQQYPFEYQTDFGKADEWLQIAQAMAQQRSLMRPEMQGKMVSGHYVRRSPMQGLADLFASYQQGQALRMADKAKQDAIRKVVLGEQQDTQNVLEALSGRPEMPAPGDYGPGERPQLAAVPADPVKAVQMALASKFPNVQKIGEQLRQQMQSTFSSAAPRATPESLDAALQAGGNPQLLRAKPEERWGPVENLAPGASEPIFGVRETRSGKPIFAPQPSKNQTNISLGDKTDAQAIIQERDFLYGKDGTKLASDLRSGISVLASSLEALATLPLNTGVDSDWKTFAQSLASVTGAKVPENVPATQLYNSFIVPQVGRIITQFGAGTGLSDADREFAKKAVALATNDPRMIGVALAYMLRGMLKDANYLNERATTVRQAAAQAGMNPNLYPPVVNFSISIDNFAKKWGLPENFLRPGALEEWMAKVIKGPAPGTLDHAVRRNLGQPREGMRF